MTPRDDLDDLIAERTRRNPEFPRLLDEAGERQELLGRLGEARRQAGLTQTQLAARMGTSASAVARLEAGDTNPTLLTLQRYAAAVGFRVTFQLARRKQESSISSVVREAAQKTVVARRRAAVK